MSLTPLLSVQKHVHAEHRDYWLRFFRAFDYGRYLNGFREHGLERCSGQPPGLSQGGFVDIEAAGVVYRIDAIIAPMIEHPTVTRFREVGFLVRMNDEVHRADVIARQEIFQQTISVSRGRRNVALAFDFDRVAARQDEEGCNSDRYPSD